jgi:hypothetical protein
MQSTIRCLVGEKGPPSGFHGLPRVLGRLQPYGPAPTALKDVGLG